MTNYQRDFPILKFSKSKAMMTSYRENVVDFFFMRFLHEFLDSKKAIKKYATKIWIIHKVWSILVNFGHL